MANGYAIKDIRLKRAAVSVGAGATTVISDAIKLSGEDSLNTTISVTLSAAAEKTGLSIVFQDSPDGSVWSTVKSTTVTTVANVDTAVYDAQANTTNGDYLVVYDTTGQAWAVAIDKTSGGAAPTGAIWDGIEASKKAQADVSTDTTAAEVATRVRAAFIALTGFTAVITCTRDTATLTFTSVTAGVDCTAPVRKNEDDTGVGTSVTTLTATTAGSFTAGYELENNVYNSTDTATWCLGRVVMVAQTGDTATVSACLITRRL